ncbi:hypothetical protein CUU56_17255, partial [Pectobacterium parvum]|nr:hypothetical protein [Pectobacterium parvum]
MNNGILTNTPHKLSTLNINSSEDKVRRPNRSSNVSSGLTSQLKYINNSSEQLYHGVKNEIPTKRSTHLWNYLWSFSRVRSAELNDDVEDDPLTEILAEGEFIRLQAESLKDSNNKQEFYRRWKGSYLKRGLVGMGLLTGAGVIGGIWHYAGRHGYNESKGDFVFPTSITPLSNFVASCHDFQMPFDRTTLPSDLFISRNCEYNLEMDFIKNMVTQSLDFIPEINPSIREKRSIPVNNINIPYLILTIVQDQTIDWRMRNEFDLIFRQADTSPDVRHAKSSEEKHIKLLLKTIQITQQCIDNNKYGYVKYNSFESFSDILKKLWTTANNLPDLYSKNAVEKFKENYGDISTTTEPHNSSDASHGTTVPIPITEHRIIDNTVGNDTSVGAVSIAVDFVGSAAEDATESATKDAAESAAKDATESATEGATESATEGATKGAVGSAAEDATESATEGATESATEGATESATKGAVGSAAEDATESATKGAVGSAAEDATESATKGAVGSAAEDATESATKGAVGSAAEDATESATKGAVGSAAEDAPKVLPEALPEVLPEMRPKVLPEA